MNPLNEFKEGGEEALEQHNGTPAERKENIQ
jgi:hypothetical protein